MVAPIYYRQMISFARPQFDPQAIPANFKRYEKVCPCCERTFYALRPQAVFCSTTCRSQAFRKKDEERQALVLEKGKRYWGGRVRFKNPNTPVMVKGVMPPWNLIF